VMSETFQSLLTEVMAQAPPSYPVIKPWHCISFVVWVGCTVQ
jgi:hypothetical protein